MTPPNPEEQQRVYDTFFRGHAPISNLYDEGFRPLPGSENTYYLPGAEIFVQCGDRFVLNASLKRTFKCYRITQYGRRIPGSDFDVQINPWAGDEGFSPYREPR